MMQQLHDLFLGSSGLLVVSLDGGRMLTCMTLFSVMCNESSVCVSVSILPACISLI